MRKRQAMRLARLGQSTNQVNSGSRSRQRNGLRRSNPVVLHLLAEFVGPQERQLRGVAGHTQLKAIGVVAVLTSEEKDAVTIHDVEERRVVSRWREHSIDV